MKGSSQNGNVLFVILLGVALFAALGYTFANLGRGSQTMDAHEAKIHAQQILKYASQVRSSVNAMMFSGVDARDFCFDHAGWPAGTRYFNAPGCGTEKNEVFGPMSGVSFENPDTKWLDESKNTQTLYGQWLYSGVIRVVGVGTSNTELVMYLQPIKKEVCDAINRLLNLPETEENSDYVENGIDQPKQFGHAPAGLYYDDDDLHGNGGAIGWDDAAATFLYGKMAGCGHGSSNGYYFYQVLVPR